MQWRGKEVYCKYADDLCDVASCKYGFCVRNRLLANGLCGMTVKKVTKMDEIPLEKEVEGVKVRGKLQQRLGEKELY